MPLHLAAADVFLLPRLVRDANRKRAGQVGAAHLMSVRCVFGSRDWRRSCLCRRPTTYAMPTPVRDCPRRTLFALLVSPRLVPACCAVWFPLGFIGLHHFCETRYARCDGRVDLTAAGRADLKRWGWGTLYFFTFGACRCASQVQSAARSGTNMRLRAGVFFFGWLIDMCRSAPARVLARECGCTHDSTGSLVTYVRPTWRWRSGSPSCRRPPCRTPSSLTGRRRRRRPVS
jgi:hypothetical protein